MNSKAVSELDEALSAIVGHVMVYKGDLDIDISRKMASMVNYEVSDNLKDHYKPLLMILDKEKEETFDDKTYVSGYKNTFQANPFQKK